MNILDKAEIAALASASSTGDVLSVLISNPKCPLAKMWRSDGTIESYSKAKYFYLKTVKVRDIHGLSKLLKRLEIQSNGCLIRGKYVGDELAKERIKDEYEVGKVLRRNEVFEDQPLHTILIEVDDFEPIFTDLSADHFGSIQEYIALHLPNPFFNASFHWQLSNSAGHPTKQGKLKVHLWFWLAIPRNSAELKAWAKAINLQSDHSVFNAIQIHYTSAPTFEADQFDPIPERSGFFRGEHDVVELDLQVIPEERPTSPDNRTVSKHRNVTEPDMQNNDLDERSLILCEVNDKTIGDLRSALMALKSERADDRKQWIDVIESLASLKITSYSEEALALAHEFSQRCLEKYKNEELESTWKGMNPARITYRSIFAWAMEDGWINPRSSAALLAGQTHTSRIDRTDAGNTSLLADITDGNLRYVPERNQWLWWDGQRWVVDQFGTAAQAQALAVAEHYHKKAAEFRSKAPDKMLDATESKRIDKIAEGMEKWATQCRNKRAIDSMLSLAKSDERFTLPVAELDRDPWLFGVENGAVDLRTGTLREAGRDDYVTRRSPVWFDPDAIAPRWQQFIDEITASPDLKNPHCHKARPELADYLRRALGYAITGATSEHKMFIAIGDGSNGKNVLLDTLQRVMGDYCQTIPPEALMAAKYALDAERPSPTTAMLAGARVAIGSESKDGQKLDVALVKRHTGGGYMTARYMRENTFRFEITHKLWLMTNHRPMLDHMDEALRGRLHLIPFDMRWNRPGHPDRNPSLPDGDKNLMDKLKKEDGGILAWLIAAAVSYYRQGLEPTDDVVRMTKSYFKENDLFERWLVECCEQCDAKLGMKASDLYEYFENWCAEEGYSNVTPHNQKAFSNELIKRGIQKHKINDGMRYGLILRSKQKVTGDGL